MNCIEKEVHDYIVENVNVFVEPMVMSIVLQRPANPIKFAIEWLTNNLSSFLPQSKSQYAIQENKETDEFDEVVRKKIINRKNQRLRTGISEEVFGLHNKKSILAVRQIQKSAETKLLIKSLIKNSILFQNLDDQDEDLLIKAMKEKNCDEHEIIIREEEKGDSLYIVESGEYDCYKRVDGEMTFIKCYGPGEAFGELSLMYNAPRAATIITKTAGRLFLLDRVTFSHVLKSATLKKRAVYKEVFNQIQIFKSLSDIQKQQFIDILKEERFEEGHYIIRQGQKGHSFYIVVDGMLMAEKKQDSDELPKIVYRYRTGDYFGELSLLHDINRQASIKAATKVRLAVVNKESFKRIFGDIQQVLKANSLKYKQAEDKL